jgi:surface polysaccharide O-acyltransferase-like enzyme
MQQNPPVVKKHQTYDGLDLMKAMAIYFVLIYHFPIMEVDFIGTGKAEAYSNFFIFSIFSTCVPIFFFINGALLFNKSGLSLKAHVSKILKTVILVIIWGFITMISLSLIYGESISLSKIIKDIYTLKIGWVNHLWFLEALVVIYIFFPLLFLAFKTKKNYFYFFFACVMILSFGNIFLGLLLNVASTVSGKFLNTYFFLNYFGGFNAFSGIHGFTIGYFMLGGIAFSLKDSILTNRNRILSLVAIPVSMALLFSYGVLISFRQGETWDIGFEAFDSVFALVMVISIFILSMQYKSRGLIGKGIRHVSKNTLGIYLLHRIVGALIKPVFIGYGFFSTFIGGMVFAGTILFLSLLVIFILKKIPYFNYLFSLRLKFS